MITKSTEFGLSKSKSGYLEILNHSPTVYTLDLKSLTTKTNLINKFTFFLKKTNKFKSGQEILTYYDMSGLKNLRITTLMNKKDVLLRVEFQSNSKFFLSWIILLIAKIHEKG